MTAAPTDRNPAKRKRLTPERVAELQAQVTAKPAPADKPAATAGPTAEAEAERRAGSSALSARLERFRRTVEQRGFTEREPDGETASAPRPDPALEAVEAVAEAIAPQRRAEAATRADGSDAGEAALIGRHLAARADRMAAVREGRTSVAELLGPAMRTWDDLSPAEQAALNAEMLARIEAGIAAWREEFRTQGARLIGAIQTAAEAQGRPLSVTPGREIQPSRRASLPRFHRIDERDVERLPADMPAHTLPSEPWFPEMADDMELQSCPSWLLWLYDRCGGRELAGKRGADWSFRLFVYAFMHLHVDDRDGEWRSRRFLEETVIDWLHPDGWANRKRDADKLPRALARMNEKLSILPIGEGWLPILNVGYAPRQGIVEFNMRLPESAASGARVDWPALVRSGTVSDAVFRAHLAAATFLDRTASRGQAITADIAAPVTGRDGRPKRRKDGGIVRSRDELQPNPLKRLVRPLSDKDLANMIGLDPEDRHHRARTRKAFERLHEDGVIDLRRERGGVRIYGPKPPVVIDGG